MDHKTSEVASQAEGVLGVVVLENRVVGSVGQIDKVEEANEGIELKTTDENMQARILNKTKLNEYYEDIKVELYQRKIIWLSGPNEMYSLLRNKHHFRHFISVNDTKIQQFLDFMILGEYKGVFLEVADEPGVDSSVFKRIMTMSNMGIDRLVYAKGKLSDYLDHIPTEMKYVETFVKEVAVEYILEMGGTYNEGENTDWTDSDKEGAINVYGI